MLWKIYGERMFRAMRLYDRFRETKVIRFVVKETRLVFVNLDRRASIHKTPYVWRLQMPEHVAVRARSSHEERRREEMRVFFAEGESREFIS